jgi:hypothetical protein
MWMADGEGRVHRVTGRKGRGKGRHGGQVGTEEGEDGSERVMRKEGGGGEGMVEGRGGKEERSGGVWKG